MVWLPRVRERCGGGGGDGGGDGFRLFKVRVASRRITGCIWISRRWAQFEILKIVRGGGDVFQNI